jgi:hypothetical protein
MKFYSMNQCIQKVLNKAATMKNILFAFILLIPFASATPQSFQFGIGAGKMMYKQEPLKTFNSGILRSIPFTTSVTDNFPATNYYQGEIGYNFRRFFLGVNYAYNSTGSRHTLSDYSGSYYYDVILSGHMPGVSLGLFSGFNNRWKLYSMSDFGAVFSSLKLEESFVLGTNPAESENLELETLSYFARPQLRLSYEFYNIKVSLSGGYFIDFGAPFHFKDDKENKLMNSRNEEVRSGWNGFTTGLNVYFVL